MSITRVNPSVSGVSDAGDLLTASPEQIQAYKAEIDAATKTGPAVSTASAPDYSDDYLAEVLINNTLNRYRWTAGKDWMVYNGELWQQDRSKTRYTMARKVCRDEAQGANEKERKAICAAKTVNAVVTLAQYDPRIVVDVDEWDRDPMMLNTPLGIVDLSSGRMQRRIVTDYVTQITTVSPDSKCSIDRFSQFLVEVFQGDREVIDFIQRLLGYALTGSRKEQIVAFCYGVGANGKNTLLDLYMDILGTYALKLGADVLISKSHAGHPTELAQLHGKRFAFSNEIERGDYWNEARLKELTGDTHISARYMRQDFFTFEQTQKHIICGNFRPRLKGGDAGMSRRMVLVPFDACFKGAKKDAELPAKLANEAPGILNWLIEGAVIWSNEGLNVPEQIRAASEQYMEDMDDFGEWVAECCEFAPEAKGRAKLMFSSWAAWKKQRGESPGNAKGFKEEIVRRYPSVKHKRGGDGVFYSGINLTREESSAAEERMAKSV